MSVRTRTPQEQATWEYLGRLAEAAKREEVGANSQTDYRWGRRTNRDWNYMPGRGSGDAAIYGSQDLMNARVRDQKRNNAQVKKICESLVDLVVGCGIQTFADPFDPLLNIAALTPSDLEQSLHYAIESDLQFKDYASDRNQFDVAGKLNAAEMQRMAMSECVETGDAIIVRCKKKRAGDQISTCYQMVERDQLDQTKDRVGGNGENRILNGIELDEQGREVAFHLYDVHPYDTFTGASLKSTRVTAERVIHLCQFTRPSQNIGVNWLHAIGQNNFDRDKFMGNEIQTSAKSALLCLVAKRKNLYGADETFGLDDGDDQYDQYGNPEVRLGSTTLAVNIHKDDDVQLLESARPNDRLEPFFRVLDRDTAGGSGLSYYTVTGDYAATNFSSVRAAKLDEDMHVRPIQDWFAGQVALPFRRTFHTEAIARGIITSVKAGDYLKNRTRYSQFDALGPGREMLDPTAETEAAAGRCRSAFSTLKIECAKRGLHWILVLRQIALENALQQMLGVKVDFSKGQGGQLEKSSSSAGKKAEAA